MRRIIQFLACKKTLDSGFRRNDDKNKIHALSHFVYRQRAIVLVRRIFFCNCRMPWISASAVGGQPGT